MPPLLMTSFRFFLVALILVPFNRIKRKQLPLIAKLAVSFGLMHFSLLFLGMTYTDAGTAAMIVQLGTPFAMIGAVIFLREGITPVKFAGVIISLTGMVVLSGSPTLSSYKGVIILLFSALGWAISNILIKHDRSLSSAAMSGWMSLFALPLTAMMSLLFEKNQLVAIHHASWHAWFAIIYSAVVCSVLAYSLWYWLLRKYEVNIIIPFTLLSPAMAITLGVMFNGDSLNWFKAIGSLLIILGAFLATCTPVMFSRLLPPWNR